MTYTNASEFRRAAKTEFAALALDSEEQVVDLARDMSKTMRDNAPTMDEAERAARLESSPGSVRSKPGKTTIRFQRGRDREGFFCDVGPSKAAFYLAFLEWGTSKLTARPFLRPSIESAISRWGNR